LRGGGENLREHLVTTAARLMAERGSAGLSVRDIAREAQVADGALYNYFEDKEDLLAHALLAHVGAVMSGAAPMAAAGTRTVAENLEFFIDRGLDVLGQVTPAFAGLQSQPGVAVRFHDMAGGRAAFGVADEDTADGGDASGTGIEAPRATGGSDAGGPEQPGGRPRGLPETLRAYLDAEQQLGRVAGGTDIDAAVMLIVGAIHGQILPQVLLSPPGQPLTTPPGFGGRLARLIMTGLAPG
jgi:AcrR family transcriptional regulator